MWVKLARAYSTFSRLAVEDIRRHGLTQPQFGIIESLGHLGHMTLGDLSRKQLSSCGNTTVVVDNLEKEGLVERRGCKKDRRSIYVHLTPKGKRRFDGIFLQHAKFIQEISSVISAQEQDQLSGLLKKLGLALADHVKPGD